MLPEDIFQQMMFFTIGLVFSVHVTKALTVFVGCP